MTATISADGRYVAFESQATNLVPGDTNAKKDVFVHDRLTGVTTRVSVGSGGVEGDNDSYDPSISADGRYVAFESRATNLVPGDTNSVKDVFVHDRLTGTTERVSINSAGVEGDKPSFAPSVSADGRFVAFDSGATNLVNGDTNAWRDVFVHDRLTGTTERVSVDSAGVEGDSGSYAASISADGRFVAFYSLATNLVPGDTNNRWDVFVHDRMTATTELVSVDSAGVQSNHLSSDPSISADGRFVAFESRASNLVPGDTNNRWDVFVRDRQTATTERVSIDSAGAESNGNSFAPSISADGRFVAFDSLATNLASGDSNGVPDVFVHDRQTATTERVSISSTGVGGNHTSRLPSISADGRFVAFESYATTLVSGDTNVVYDIFVHGPHLTLEATPDVASSGTLLTFTTWRSQPNSLNLLAAVELNGFPAFIPVLLSLSDGQGISSLSAPVPAALAGNVVGFMSVGFTPTGSLEPTNVKTVTFQ